MCGIIGYLGPKEALSVLLEGLRRLEYRGYDSAGIALVDDGVVHVRRSAGRLSRLEEILRTEPIRGTYGVGHTRWATHGRPNEENAHPHRDCTGRLVVVHNGIIENYLSLKRQLEAQGHRFATETDTEIVAHLVERELRGDGLEQAVRRALPALSGVFALVLVAADDPDKIVAVRNGPPLVVGLGEGEYLVASDVPALLAHTRDVIYLADEEMAVLTRRGVTFTDFHGRPRAKTAQQIRWDPVQAEKAGYKHFMLKEIYEQPWAIRETLAGRISLDTNEVRFDELALEARAIQSVRRIVILACGTSWHAGLVGKFYLEHLARLPVEVDYGSEFRYRTPVVDDQTLAVVITQSGETADTLAALREAKRRGALSLAVCNVVGSMATREADGTLYIHAGPEIGVASTKAFTAQLVALHLLALYLGRLRGTLSPAQMTEQLASLTRLPRLIEQTLRSDDLVEQIARRFAGYSDFLYLGRGINYPIALEGALKLKEISYIHAEGYPAGEMKHGPIALIDEQMPVVALAPRDHIFDKMLGNILEAKARGALIIAVTTEGDRSDLDAILDPTRDCLLTVPASHPFHTPILLAVPLQLLAYHIAVRRGCDVDQPRNLAKSVTVE
jgi:glucosamine--fructose-6-phosphate aminotransferase (isomerizing)